MRCIAPLRSDRGFVLVTAIMFVLILSVLGASLLAHGPMENSLITDRNNNTQAFYYAEAGISRQASLLSFDIRLDLLEASRPASLPLSRVPFLRAIQYRGNGVYDSTGVALIVNQGSD